ncbi:MAG: hypothetical protein E7340_00555 [Clostridiales bacterium]|nr:hypothetical protein [Clostridiales bacterium]
MKKLLAIILAILTMFTFTACSSGSDNSTPPTEPEQETAVCYEFKYYKARFFNEKDYYWGDSYDGKVFTEKYAKFILKNDGNADVWWKNSKYTGRWKNVGEAVKIVFDNEKQSVSVEKRWRSVYGDGWYEYFIFDIGEENYRYEDDYICLTKYSNYKI